jgi:3-hydroxybutyryl-CoA dehydrogenase
MGRVIAFRCAMSGLKVNLFDISPGVRAQALDTMQAWLAERVASGAVQAEQGQAALSGLHSCNSLQECVADVELVIEVVPENLTLKRQVFAEIDRLAPDEALIATNSSSLPCSRLAGATGRPDKVLNIHFPIRQKDGLPVEVMGAPLTARETILAGERFVRSLGLLPIVVKREVMGFGINTIWHEIKRAALHLVDGGHLDFEDIDRAWMLMRDQPRGIFADMDLIGLDVIRDIEMQYYQESGDERDRPPQFLDDLVAQGHLGEKSGQGFYSYPSPEYEQPGWLRKEPPWTEDQAILLDEIIKRRNTE